MEWIEEDMYECISLFEELISDYGQILDELEKTNEKYTGIHIDIVKMFCSGFNNDIRPSVLHVLKLMKERVKLQNEVELYEN